MATVDRGDPLWLCQEMKFGSIAGGRILFLHALAQ
jgi:hypothetical protein